MTLKELPVGKSGLITAVGGEGILRCRLLDMGLIPNTRVTVQKIAPMGDPMEIRLRSYELTLRMDDAAQIDGCGRLRQFVSIYLPLSGPLLASLGMLKFTGTWNEYTWPLVMTSGDRMKTVQLALTGFRDEAQIFWNQLMAATLISSLPIYLLFFFAQDAFVSGLLAGSVKA